MFSHLGGSFAAEHPLPPSAGTLFCFFVFLWFFTSQGGPHEKVRPLFFRLLSTFCFPRSGRASYHIIPPFPSGHGPTFFALKKNSFQNILVFFLPMFPLCCLPLCPSQFVPLRLTRFPSEFFARHAQLNSPLSLRVTRITYVVQIRFLLLSACVLHSLPLGLHGPLMSTIEFIGRNGWFGPCGTIPQFPFSVLE